MQPPDRNNGACATGMSDALSIICRLSACADLGVHNFVAHVPDVVLRESSREFER